MNVVLTVSSGDQDPSSAQTSDSNTQSSNAGSTDSAAGTDTSAADLAQQSAAAANGEVWKCTQALNTRSDIQEDYPPGTDTECKR